MDDDRFHDLDFGDLDDDLFPLIGPTGFGRRHTDEYGVTYVADHIPELGWVWVPLGTPGDRD